MKNDLLEQLGSGNNSAIIDSSTKTFDLDRKAINGAYLIPPILAGEDVKTGFSTESLKDAYNVFNAFTQPGRDRIAKEINKILKAGNFGIDKIKLTPMSLEVVGSEAGNEEETLENQDSKVADNTTLTNLTGRQMQGIMRIVRKFNKGELTFEQASSLLSGGFGFTPEEIDSWLFTKEEEEQEAAKDGEPQIKINE
jgi:hypothetical protein